MSQLVHWRMLEQSVYLNWLPAPRHSSYSATLRTRHHWASTLDFFSRRCRDLWHFDCNNIILIAAYLLILYSQIDANFPCCHYSVVCSFSMFFLPKLYRYAHIIAAIWHVLRTVRILLPTVYGMQPIDLYGNMQERAVHQNTVRRPSRRINAKAYSMIC